MSKINGKPSVRLVKREAIDFDDVAAESGLRSGKLCYSKVFGWGVQNTNNCLGPDFGCVSHPIINSNQILKIEDNHWCIYEKIEVTG